MRFSTPLFLSSFEPAWATDKWVKIFLVLVSFSPRYSSSAQYHTAWSQVLRSIILRGIM